MQNVSLKGLKMLKHKKLVFTVTNVHFINGWASFNSYGIEDFMEEVKFKDTYEEVK